VLRELAPGVSAKDVQSKTEPVLHAGPDLVTMSL
jgi:acyl CoA:acetate/3-ketoacid CoA transferase beta subunit